MKNNTCRRKISAMVLTLMISASAAAAVQAVPATAADDDNVSIVSSAENDYQNDDSPENK